MFNVSEKEDISLGFDKLFDQSVFKKRTKECLAKAGLTQKDLATRLDVTERTLSRWLNGENKFSVDERTVERIASILHVDSLYLYWEAYSSPNAFAEGSHLLNNQREKQLTQLYQPLFDFLSSIGFSVDFRLGGIVLFDTKTRKDVAFLGDEAIEKLYKKIELFTRMELLNYDLPDSE